jgi:hypothetical protein
LPKYLSSRTEHTAHFFRTTAPATKGVTELTISTLASLAAIASTVSATTAFGKFIGQDIASIDHSEDNQCDILTTSRKSTITHEITPVPWKRIPIPSTTWNGDFAVYNSPG